MVFQHIAVKGAEEIRKFMLLLVISPSQASHIT